MFVVKLIPDARSVVGDYFALVVTGVCIFENQLHGRVAYLQKWESMRGVVGEG